MSAPTEQELRAAFASRALSVSPAAAHRLKSADYHPRERRLPAFAGLGAVGASLVAAAALVAVLLSSGTPVAFAGWTAVPTASSPTALRAARAACGSIPGKDVIAADQRGPYTAIVYQRGTKPTECVTDGRHVLVSQSTLYAPRMFASPGAGNVTLPIPSRRWWTQPRRRLTAVSGTVGSGVSGVSLRLANGTSVKATVGHGWYLAWWPGSFASRAYPTSITVTTAAGTHRAPYSASRLHALFAGCRLGTSCGAFEKAIQGVIDLIPSLPPQLIKHYRLFRDVSPNPVPSTLIRQRDLLPPQNIKVMGLDLSQIRSFQLSRGRTLYVVPGSAGICVVLRFAGGGLMSCDPSPSAWQQGTIGLGGGGDLQGVITYYAIALVPDTNRTVTVRLSDGRRVVIPVHDNIALRGFPIQPTQIIFRNATGKLTQYGRP